MGPQTREPKAIVPNLCDNQLAEICIVDEDIKW